MDQVPALSPDIPAKVCPFYGFASMAGLFIEQKGNQCPLKDGYSPCHMEMEQKPVDWFKCQYSNVSNKEAVEEILEKGTIFPEALKPPGLDSWKGIRLKDWFQFVLEDRDPPA